MGVAEVELTFDFEETLGRFEREYLRVALRCNRGAISRTARRIGMNKTTLLRRIRAHGLEVKPVASTQSEPNSAEKIQIRSH
jgi:DNA-binding NtrC family response regulator